VRLCFPVVAVGFAAIARERGFGLFNWLQVPDWIAFIASVIVLDLAIWAQHLLFHKVPILWRLHRMHHADLDFDATTGVRFHPVEVLLSMLVKLAVVAMLGPPAIAVMVFEVVLNASAMFSHGNLRLPSRVDRVLRWLIVTPDMHRVHHSVDRAEHDRNYGFNLSVWDRLFGTYLAQPHDGHEGMVIGVSTFRTRRDLWLDRMLWQPLRRG
jgi:sterol desaturase/sphingolipid hydroxylase (fatty acid hydroxylase superfamily)